MRDPASITEKEDKGRGGATILNFPQQKQGDMLNKLLSMQKWQQAQDDKKAAREQNLLKNTINVSRDVWENDTKELRDIVEKYDKDYIEADYKYGGKIPFDEQLKFNQRKEDALAGMVASAQTKQNYNRLSTFINANKNSEVYDTVRWRKELDAVGEKQRMDRNFNEVSDNTKYLSWNATRTIKDDFINNKLGIDNKHPEGLYDVSTQKFNEEQWKTALNVYKNSSDYYKAYNKYAGAMSAQGKQPNFGDFEAQLHDAATLTIASKYAKTLSSTGKSEATKLNLGWNEETAPMPNGQYAKRNVLPIGQLHLDFSYNGDKSVMPTGVFQDPETKNITVYLLNKNQIDRYVSNDKTVDPLSPEQYKDKVDKAQLAIADAKENKDDDALKTAQSTLDDLTKNYTPQTKSGEVVDSKPEAMNNTLWANIRDGMERKKVNMNQKWIKDMDAQYPETKVNVNPKTPQKTEQKPISMPVDKNNKVDPTALKKGQSYKLNGKTYTWNGEKLVPIQ